MSNSLLDVGTDRRAACCVLRIGPAKPPWPSDGRRAVALPFLATGSGAGMLAWSSASLQPQRRRGVLELLRPYLLWGN